MTLWVFETRLDSWDGWLTNCGMVHVGSKVYQWGYSFIQLFITLVLTITWCVGLSVMRIVSRAKLPLVGWPREKTPGGRKTLLVLAEAMNAEFKAAQIEPIPLTDRRLGTEIRKRLGGGSVQFAQALSRPGKLRPKVEPGSGLRKANGSC